MTRDYSLTGSPCPAGHSVTRDSRDSDIDSDTITQLARLAGQHWHRRPHGGSLAAADFRVSASPLTRTLKSPGDSDTAAWRHKALHKRQLPGNRMTLRLRLLSLA